MNELKNEVYKIKEIIFDKTGIVIKNNKLKYLVEEVQKILNKYEYEDINKYIKYLGASDVSDEKFNLLINSLKIDESYFFRSIEQINFIKNIYIPKLLEYKRKNNDNKVCFWSAGCSKGQEAYTLGMLFYDFISSINEVDKWDITIFGSDIDNKSLNIAKTGVYTKWSLRGVEDKYIEKYFIKDQKENYKVNLKIKKNIKFEKYNLINKSAPDFLKDGKVDLILCRNVFIYFDKSIISNVVEKFSEILSDQGCLIIGDTEKIDLNKKIKLKFAQNAKYTFYTSVNCTLFDEIKLNLIKSNRKYIVNSYKANKLLQKDNLSFSNNINEEIHHLANINKLDEALKLCNKQLVKNSLDQDLYLLQALIYFEQEKEDEFEKALRKALFLEPSNVVARYYLGIYLYQKGMKQKGISNLKIALSNAEKKDEGYKISLLKDVSYKEFISALKDEIKNYE